MKHSPLITTPLSAKLQATVSGNSGRLLDEYENHLQHFHIYDPEKAGNNIARFKDVLEKRDLDATIHMALKANDSCYFVAQAKKSNINVEVASIAELKHVLDHGFKGQEIIAGGIKGIQYLNHAVEVGAIIVLDGTYELDYLSQISGEKEIHVLYRINHPNLGDRTIQSKATKFGIDIEEIKNLIINNNNPKIIHRGLHFHSDEKNTTIRASLIMSTIKSLVGLSSHFIDPIIDLGGGRGWTIYNESTFNDYFLRLTNQFREKKETLTWGENAFGLSRTPSGTMSNSKRARGLFPTKQGREFLNEVLNEEIDGVVLGEALADSDVQIVIEPGGSLLVGAGLTVLPIIGTKTISDGREAVIVDANIHNISAKMIEYHADPILIQKEFTSSENKRTGYVIGNLCRPDDVLIKRCVLLNQKPKRGDLLVLTNTAAYISNFDNAQPHRHPLGKEIVI